ncbi:hypothetical protein GCM10022405_28950 [Gibbsiella dentisursi]|uniref:Flavoprotein n=1 Tax=Gibbsiella dentisursi TaxID=796890 RepID=A0ABP7LHG6_9GAMM
MDSQALSQLLDTIIAELVAQKKPAVPAGDKDVRVLITGDDMFALPATLDCLAALASRGYPLRVYFSHSAGRSPLKTQYMQAIARQCPSAVCHALPPGDMQDTPYGCLFLPALSGNSMSKIALGIRDNIAGEWVFDALSRQKQVIVTLNNECLAMSGGSLAAPWLARLASYAQVLASYGIVISGRKPAGPCPTAVAGAHRPLRGKKTLITLRDIRLHPAGEPLAADSNTLITPAALDEIRRRHISITQR